MARTPRTVRLSEGERALLSAAAERKGVPMSTYLRRAGVRLATKDLGTTVDPTPSGMSEGDDDG